jgi:hypothetical protein
MMRRVLVLAAWLSMGVVAAHAEELLPVWAVIDADTPLVGATVRVVAAGRVVRQVDGRTSERTNEDGVAGFVFATSPPAFTVVVSGGRAEGKRVRGTLKTEVAAYEPDTIVYVNPATTLLAELRDRDQALAEPDATRTVRSVLGLPRWHDLTADVNRTDRWFGGDAFLTAARWRVGHLIDRLADEPDMRHAFRDQANGEIESGTPQAAPPVLELGRDAAFRFLEVLIPEGHVLGPVLGILGEIIKGAIDGGDDVKEALAAIDRHLGDIKKAIADLETKIQQSRYDVLVGETVQDVTRVQSRFADLRWLAATNTLTKGRLTRAAQLIADIGNPNDKLVDVVARLDGHLRGIAGSSGILVAGSQLVATKARPFFGPSDSAKIRAIYDYYRQVQSTAGILWAGYQAVRPDEYDAPDIATDAKRISGIIERQGTPEYLKPAVPADFFVDMRTRTMWTRTLDQRVNGLQYEQTYRTPRDPRFSGFQPPAIADLEQLVQGRGDQSAAEWLRKTAKTTGVLNGRVWVDISIRDFTSGLTNANKHIRFRWFDLSTGKFDQNCGGAPYLGCPAYCRPTKFNLFPTCPKQREAALSKESAFLMYKRPLAANEQYWFDG